MYRYLFLILLVSMFTQLSFAAGENTKAAETGYVLEDFELTVSEKQKIEDSKYKLDNARINIKEKDSRVLLIHQIDSDRSEELEDLLSVLLENGYFDNINYLYKVKGIGENSLDDQQYLDLQVRLVLKQYLPEIFYKYIKFRKNNIDISTSMYYSGVSPDVVYELVSKYGAELAKENAVQIKNYDQTIKAPELYINETVVKKYDLDSIMAALNYQNYQTSENIELKLFVSYAADLDFLPIKVNENNTVRLTRAESLKVADQLDISELPFAFVKSDNKETTVLYDNGFVKKDDYFIIEGVGPLKYFKQRSLSPGRIDVFISGSDKDSIKMLNSLSVLKDKTEIVLHPVMRKNDLENASVPAKFLSSGGQEEVKENLRLICLYNSSKEDFWKYIEQKYKDPGKDWEGIYKEANINIEEITTCAYSEMGERYIKEGLFLVNDLNIEKIPQILWQNQYLSGSLKLLEQLESFDQEIEKARGTK